MMKHCIVRIVTRSEGESSVKTFSARLAEEDGGWNVSYCDGEDRVSLRYRDSFFHMSREGAVGLEAVFSKGGRTEMVFRAEGAASAVAVSVNYLEQRRNANGYFVRLGYRLHFSGGLKKYDLKITIKDISEER